MSKRQTKEDLFSEYSNDIRKSWRVLNSLIGRANDKTYLSESFAINDNRVSDEQTIANGFAKYFSSIGQEFAEAIPKSNHTSEYYMKTAPNKHSIFLAPTDPSEINKILGLCKNKKSSGDDGLILLLLKQLRSVIDVPIAMLGNLSVSQGTVPDAMKLVKVVPIYKAKSKEIFTNYRPISLLSNI